MSRSVKSEIDRRTTDASKLAALEARKCAILEMVAGLMQEAVDLMKSEGFTAPAVVQPPQQVPVHSAPLIPGTTVIQEAQLAAAPAPQVKNPCASCGQEAAGTEDMPDGSKKYLCRAHFQARAIEKQQEQTTKQLMGSEGTLYVRPKLAPAQPVKKIVIQSGPDPLLGNGPAPVNSVLDEND